MLGSYLYYENCMKYYIYIYINKEKWVISITNITKFSFCITHLMSNTAHALFYFISNDFFQKDLKREKNETRDPISLHYFILFSKHHERLRVHSKCTVARTKRKGLNQMINHERKKEIKSREHVDTDTNRSQFHRVEAKLSLEQ